MNECPVCLKCYEETLSTCPEDGNALNFSWPGDCTILDQYRLDKVIGKGSLGVIYQATQINLMRSVAVKILSPHLVNNSEAINHFRTEALAAARLNHPNIIKIYDYGTLPKQRGAYIAMKLLRGQTLTKEIAQLKQLSFPKILEIMKQATFGIAHAHASHIVHCDLKPDNIMLDITEKQEEVVQIVDFGIARLREISGTGTLYSLHTGAAIGNPAYMSPEQCLGEKLYNSSDIYSLAVILYEMLTGQVPFIGKTAADTALQHIQNPPPKASEFRQYVAPSLDMVILKALAKSPQERFTSALSFLEAFEPALKVSEEQYLKANPIKSATGNASRNSAMLKTPTVGATGALKKLSQLTFPHISILLVDDEEHILETISVVLKELECQIITAHDGEEAWQKLRQNRVHLIISDINMPNVDGWQLFFRYKTDPALEIIPFVFITGRDIQEEKITALEQGVEDYWIKPFILAEFTVRIKRLLQRISVNVG